MVFSCMVFQCSIYLTMSVPVFFALERIPSQFLVRSFEAMVVYGERCSETAVLFQTTDATTDARNFGASFAIQQPRSSPSLSLENS